MAAILRTRRFTVDEYQRMGETGILASDERLELIAGRIVVREPIGSRHASTVDRLTRLWTSRLGERAIVRIQNPVRFAKEDSEVQPDVMLLRPRDDFYATSHPVAADVLLLIEVADTTIRLERRVRLPLYARVGVRESWLCDLVSQRVEVYREPLGNRYRDLRVLTRGGPLASLAFPDVALIVDDLLG
jgi:Uma2 family endonuclease